MWFYVLGEMFDAPHSIASQSPVDVPPWHIVVKLPSTQFDAGYSQLSSLFSVAVNPVTSLPAISNNLIS